MYYGSQIFTSQTINEEPVVSRSISPVLLMHLQLPHRNEYLKRANNLIDVCGIKIRLSLSSATLIKLNKNLLNQNFS